ncbi:hypothetical protein KC336_g7 [Hortaea werneckii]|nr:hypothetical protein KC336_g7 [Hortaea werneckii]
MLESCKVVLEVTARDAGTPPSRVGGCRRLRSWFSLLARFSPLSVASKPIEVLRKLSPGRPPTKFTSLPRMAYSSFSLMLPSRPRSMQMMTALMMTSCFIVLRVPNCREVRSILIVSTM